MAKVIDSLYFKIAAFIIIGYSFIISAYTYIGDDLRVWLGDEIGANLEYTLYWIAHNGLTVGVCLIFQRFVLPEKIRVMFKVTSGFLGCITLCQILTIWGIEVSSYMWGSFVYLYTIIIILIYKYGKC